MGPLQHLIPGAVLEILRSAPLSDGKVTFAWHAVVGPALGRATAVKLERGTLIVETTSAQWSREVQRSHGMILSRLQPFLGAEAVTHIITRTPHAEDRKKRRPARSKNPEP